ncbi:DUF2505 domain-containing protein [Demequina globuliformis]|uniref:DUF2505 domain-containing protein n=1 Tax=Demequina globuliformis TaxID=676202 RepID=UPI00078323B0|nr:DUF2505 domain-containing protein [Demequina globuliformis]
MHFTHEHHFDAPVEDVFAMLADKEFAVKRAETSGADASDAVFSGSIDEGFTVAIRRVVPSSSIPQEFRGFIGSDLTVRYSEVWSAPRGTERQGTFSVEIVGAPGHASGRLLLTPEGNGTDFVVDGTVTVRVPLFGAMIEKSLLKNVIEGLETELQAADAWLAAR